MHRLQSFWQALKCVMVYCLLVTVEEEMDMPILMLLFHICSCCTFYFSKRLSHMPVLIHYLNVLQVHHLAKGRSIWLTLTLAKATTRVLHNATRADEGGIRICMTLGYVAHTAGCGARSEGYSGSRSPHAQFCGL